MKQSYLRVALGAAAVIGGLSGAGAAGAGIIRHDREDAQYQLLAASFPSVGRVDSTLRDDFIAGGVLITPTWVLSAAHISFDGLVPDRFIIDGQTFEIVERVLHPNYQGGSVDDVVLFRLSAAVTTVAPSLLYGGEDEIGRAGTAVGFGFTGTGTTGLDRDSVAGTKRAGTNMVDALGAARDARLKTLEIDFDSPNDPSASTMGDATPLDLEILPTFGDSGGGLFQSFGGALAVTGISSYIRDPDGGSLEFKYGDVGGFTRVSAYREFIEANVAGVVFVPEPGVGVVGLVALGVGLARRRIR